ncbi:Protein FAR1-RELATED SEQUENCE 6 [Ananas comosus]|uniref:Protein FAR1-RELATED SEQUENCE n=1 Tax=Ananas comosus TaxID=4615 RepID=A0A199VHN1_ANACO|nr:Protein FAR1-RELATED SEQUENCE 6 [Ananas comosus]
MEEEAQTDSEVPLEKDTETVSKEDVHAEGSTAELNGDQKPTDVDERVPHVGMVFKTFEEVYDFYNQYARRTGFGTKIRRSWYSHEDGQCNKVTFTCCKEEVYEIPPQYILERWRKDYKHIRVLPSSNDGVANGPLERYDDIYKNCLKLAQLGAISDDSYDVAMKVLSEAMEELISSGYATNDTQPRTYFINGNRNLRDENDDILGQLQGRRKSQPFKKRKESLAEKIVKTSKKKISQRKSTATTQSDMLRIAPSTPQFDTHFWPQESLSLTEPVNPTNLSIGGQFGMTMNHHHVLENQSGIRWSFPQMFQQAPEGPAGPWAG